MVEEVVLVLVQGLCMASEVRRGIDFLKIVSDLFRSANRICNKCLICCVSWLCTSDV